MNHSDAGARVPANAEPALSPAKGLLVLLAIIVLVALFLWLSHAVGVVQVWAGFLFILYWAGLEHVQMEKLLPSIVGSLSGLGLAYAIHALPPLLGGAGWAIVLAAIVLAVYCHVMKWVPTIVNMALMLFLTVGTVPAVQQHADLTNAFAGLVLGILFTVVLVVGGKWAAGKLGKRPTQA